MTTLGAPAVPCLTGPSVAVADLIGLRNAAGAWRARAQSPMSPGGTRRARRRGRGIDFDTVRAYQPGDDVRSIDWRVTARTGKAHTKVFREERERPVLTVVDARRNMAFGSRVRFKSVAACELAALIAWRALAAGDRSGGLIAAPDAVHLHRPSRTRSAVLAWLNALAAATAGPPHAVSTNAAPTNAASAIAAFTIAASTIAASTLAASTAASTIAASTIGAPVTAAPPPTLAAVLQTAVRVVRPGALCVVASDFHDLDATGHRALAALARHCDVVCALVFDALEAELPPPALYPLTDGATRYLLDAGNPGMRAAHQRRFDARRAALAQLCRDLHMGFGELPANLPAITLLQRQGLWPRRR